VDAVRLVVAEAPVTTADPAPEPSLHRFGLPASIRRALATWAPAQVADTSSN
jgi:hypothetical protein